MAPLPLVSKPYIGRSLIASAQRCVNLYPELNIQDKQSPTPVTHYLTPGTVLYANSGLIRPTRCTYRTSVGTAYVVIGFTVYYLDYQGNLTPIGTVADKPTQIYAADNGLVIVLVDGENGYVIDMATNRFAQINDPNFYGASFVVYLDTFFVFNRPSTNQFYISASMADWAMFTQTGIATGKINNAGSGYVGGTYENVPLINGSGSGATANIVVTENYITSLELTQSGSSYVIGYYQAVPLIYVSSTSNDGSEATANITIQKDIIDRIQITSGSLYTPGVYNNISFTGGTGTGAIGNVTVSAGCISGVTRTANGSSYVAGTYNDVPLIGGTGTGAKANITVSGLGQVTAQTITYPGSGYTALDVLTANNSYLGGAGSGLAIRVDTITTGVSNIIFTNKGSSYVLNDVLTTAAANIGGTGSGFQFTLLDIVNGISSIELVKGGKDYSINDVLTASPGLIGGTGSGFTTTVKSVNSGVTEVTLLQPGENYQIGDVLSSDAANLGGSGSGFQWEVLTLSNAFDPLDIAAKSGNADPIVGIMAIHRELWLIGELTSEVWIGTGAADFYFQQVQGAFIDHGCIAPYSCANQDILGFWLMRDKQGRCIIVQGANYQLKEISTPAIVSEIQQYSVVSDAIGFCFQQEDHAFYVLTFPTVDKTWMYDLSTESWCEWNWSDDNGNLHRTRANCCMLAYDKNIIGDWQTGKLFELRSDIYTDDGQDIIRIRTFPHLLNNLDRVTYLIFKADIEVGTQDPDNIVEPKLSLRWSDDRGKTYGNTVIQSLGKGGDYLALPTWSRLGMARDRMFELSWSCNLKTSLNGAFIEVKKAST